MCQYKKLLEVNAQAPPTSGADLSSQNSQPKALLNGLDVHNDSIAVSLAPADAAVRMTALGSTESEQVFGRTSREVRDRCEEIMSEFPF